MLVDLLHDLIIGRGDLIIGRCVIIFTHCSTDSGVLHKTSFSLVFPPSRMIMRMTSESTKKRFPQLEATWELLGYDAPATIQVQLLDGREKRFLAEHYSRYEMQNIVDDWQYEAHMQFMKENSLEKPEGE